MQPSFLFELSPIFIFYILPVETFSMSEGGHYWEAGRRYAYFTRGRILSKVSESSTSFLGMEFEYTMEICLIGPNRIQMTVFVNFISLFSKVTYDWLSLCIVIVWFPVGELQSGWGFGWINQWVESEASWTHRAKSDWTLMGYWANPHVSNPSKIEQRTNSIRLHWTRAASLGGRTQKEASIPILVHSWWRRIAFQWDPRRAIWATTIILDYGDFFLWGMWGNVWG